MIHMCQVGQVFQCTKWGFASLAHYTCMFLPSSLLLPHKTSELRAGLKIVRGKAVALLRPSSHCCVQLLCDFTCRRAWGRPSIC